MSRSRLCLLGLAALSALALACAATGKTIKGRAFFYNVVSNVEEVSPGHWTGPWKTVGVAIDDVGRKSEESHSFVETGTFDMWRSPTELKSCKNESSQIGTYRDRSTVTVNITATCKLGPDANLIFEGTSKSVGGTGRFEGVEFTGSFTAYQLTPGPGDIGYAVYTTTITKPPKK